MAEHQQGGKKEESQHGKLSKEKVGSATEDTTDATEDGFPAPLSRWSDPLSVWPPTNSSDSLFYWFIGIFKLTFHFMICHIVSYSY